MHLHRLGLGTAQWGSRPYGVANIEGVVSSNIVSEILLQAKNYGIRMLDTASMYSGSEDTLGQFNLDSFHIVTKLPKMAQYDQNSFDSLKISTALQESLNRLLLKKVYGLMVHDANDLLGLHSNQIIAGLMHLKDLGMVDKIGVSVYSPKQLRAIQKIFQPDIIQLPFNVFDQRFLLEGDLVRAKECGIEIHSRSVFLQGLLLMPVDKIPPYFFPYLSEINKWQQAAQEQGLSLVQAALSSARDNDLIDVILVGVESIDQFQSCCKDFSSAPSFDSKGLANYKEELINPSLWKLK